MDGRQPYWRPFQSLGRVRMVASWAHQTLQGANLSGVLRMPGWGADKTESTVETMASYLDLEISLDDVTPRVWRRLLLHEGASLLDVHQAIQDACGWHGTHLFAFSTPDGQVIAGVADEYGFESSVPDAAEVPARAHLEGHGAVVYEYDFGDSWVHWVELKAVVSLEETFRRRIVGGARAFPPEDCGGVPGYEDLVAVVSGGQATDQDTEDLLEWAQGWDPEAFDLAALQHAFDR